jgi:putative flavoprotein involved in K+ transport
MDIEEVEVVVVGGGQAGVAMSEHLGNAGVSHLVLERGRIAEKWRSGRWDSLVANGPAWHDRFPGLEFDGDRDAFVPKDQVADYFEAYAQKIGAPIRCGVEVTSVPSLGVPAGASSSPWVRTTGPRGATGGGTTSGGWASSASGRPRRRLRVPST